MDITQIKGAQRVHANTKTVHTQQAKKAASSRQDATEFSAQMNDFIAAKRVIAALPAVRTEKVENIAAKMAAGRYFVPSQVLADSMLDS